MPHYAMDMIFLRPTPCSALPEARMPITAPPLRRNDRHTLVAQARLTLRATVRLRVLGIRRATVYRKLGKPQKQ
jgi:hypothetical protein